MSQLYSCFDEGLTVEPAASCTNYGMGYKNFNLSCLNYSCCDEGLTLETSASYRMFGKQRPKTKKKNLKTTSKSKETTYFSSYRCLVAFFFPDQENEDPQLKSMCNLKTPINLILG